MPSIAALEGKPFYIKVDGKQRNIGRITSVTTDRVGLYVEVKITDEEAAGILGAAQDKIEASANPLGLTEAEMADAIQGALEDQTPDPGPLTQQIDFIQKADI